MRKKLTQIRDIILNQLKSYKKYPSTSQFDDGYKSAMKKILIEILELDKTLKNKDTEELIGK